MKLYINKNFGTYSTDIYLEIIEGDRRSFLEYGNDHILTKHEVQEVVIGDPKFFMRLPDNIFQEFLELMVEHANEKGIKTENENLLKGKLEATQHYLADMQKAFNKLLEKVK